MNASTGLAAAATGWGEPLTLVLMVACFGALAVWLRWPIGVALLVAAWLGAAANGQVLPYRHLVEGAFSYLDPILVITTAMIFMRMVADGGSLSAIVGVVARRLGHLPAVLLPVLMGIAMFPGMVTGSSTASVLATGTLVGTILVTLGLTKERAAAIVAMGGILGMIAPPVNLPAMLIGSGIDLPYVGFTAPLAVASCPLALAVVYGLGWPVIRKARSVQPAAAVHALQATSATMRLAPMTEMVVPVGACLSPALPPVRMALWRALMAPACALGLMLAPRAWPLIVPDPGLPLAFLVSAAVAVVLSPRFDVGRSALQAMEEVLPVAGILTGVGAFIQVMTVTGGRGWLVAVLFAAPSWAIFAAAGASIPLFGAVSAFGSASVLGVPFLLALLGRNEVVTTSALSMLAALGDLMLPAALVATLAAQAVGLSGRRAVLRLCFLPALAVAVVAVAMLVYSPQLGRWLP